MFLGVFVVCPAAIVSGALGFLGLFLYFRPSQRAKRRIRRLLALIALSCPGIALFLFMARFMYRFVAG